MADYVLLAGVHCTGGITSYPGDVVASETDLADRDPMRFIEWTDADEAALQQPEQQDEEE